jgi:hypothetical protein
LASVTRLDTKTIQLTLFAASIGRSEIEFRCNFASTTKHYQTIFYSRQTTNPEKPARRTPGRSFRCTSETISRHISQLSEKLRSRFRNFAATAAKHLAISQGSELGQAKGVSEAPKRARYSVKAAALFSLPG